MHGSVITTILDKISRQKAKFWKVHKYSIILHIEILDLKTYFLENCS